eukprot:5834356-Pleurochrysis_carterae.AAC.1
MAQVRMTSCLQLCLASLDSCRFSHALFPEIRFRALPSDPLAGAAVTAKPSSQACETGGARTYGRTALPWRRHAATEARQISIQFNLDSVQPCASLNTNLHRD